MSKPMGTTVVDSVCGISTGIVRDGEGYLALTLTASKTLKTEAGARRWLASKGYAADGSKL